MPLGLAVPFCRGCTVSFILSPLSCVAASATLLRHPSASLIRALGSGVLFGRGSSEALVAENKWKKGRWFGRWSQPVGPEQWPCLDRVIPFAHYPWKIFDISDCDSAWESICWQLAIYVNTSDFWRWVMTLQWNVLNTQQNHRSMTESIFLCCLWLLGTSAAACLVTSTVAFTATLGTLAKNSSGWTLFWLEMLFSAYQFLI